ncbi:hypothetical protein PYW07_009570 [Mythimna separata]|uniref:Uncharacterized protein n=1 Tax=Mythimna separata TaxID=271217 RepID=A0AAD7YC66_MYTSE|nr:hypothetical protein PYW07_009568 [Mythimna separata]KAJ8710203.1 hypothetical protein PYW07_009569 [Mythimna separata]KAJ8710204.1 hypothetical protein PYW07_009570 [Mythimna separata]
MTPLLRHIGYGMTWQHCMACVWGGLRGPLSLCLALIMLQTPAVSDAGEHCMACVWGGLRGPLSLCLALIMLQTPAVSDAGEVHNM